jgi:hypothetical protein
MKIKNRDVESKKGIYASCELFNMKPQTMDIVDAAIQVGGEREGKSFVLKI